MLADVTTATPYRQWRYRRQVAHFLLVLEAKEKPAAVYVPLLDAIERRLSGKRILRTAWVVEGASAQDILTSISFHLPVWDGVLIVPYGDPKVTRNLRIADEPSES
jgi:hypothetical protein